MRKSQLISAPLPLPTAPATANQRQALRDLASHVQPVDRASIVAGLDTLTYKQAAQRVGDSYLLATRQGHDGVRTYVVPDTNTPGLPQGSLVLLRCVAVEKLLVGELAFCTDLHERYTLLGRVRRVQRGKFPPDLRLTLTQTEQEHTLWARRPNVYWYRVEVISLAC